ncbi:MAG: transglycosylase domain-containing protein [Alicyclobacillus sp.]|nr:transglycosylase domain-containing protein [Alicyclobacillus sp.]
MEPLNHRTTPPRGQGSAARRAASARKEQAPRWWKITRGVLVCFGGLTVVGIGAAVGYVAALLKGLPKISASTFSNLATASVVYDRNGRVIGRFTRDGDRQPISSLDQVSPNLVNAFIAAEDKTFYSNPGINPLAMARAFVQDVAGRRIESGASTITQQTVKLAVFPEQQRTLRRKVQEIALALELNHMLSKQEIMTDYMNWVYMGRMGSQNVYGVKTASECLFHKDPRYLTLAEAAFLASIPNNPSWFSPYEYPQHVVERQHYVLKQMLLNHMIDPAEYEQALKVDVVKEIQPPPSGSSPYPYIMDNVEPLVDQALVEAGLYSTPQEADAALATAGYHIHTTIDLSMQRDVDRVLSDEALFRGTDLPVPGEPGKKDLYQAGVTLIDNQTGGILAIGGGRPPHFAEDQIDHSDIARQPGSAIKPLLDYGPAIDTEQLTAASVLADQPTVFNAGTPYAYAPHDNESYWHGIVTVRQALVESLNVPAVQVLNRIGTELGTGYLAKMGIKPGSLTVAGKPTFVQDDTQHLGIAIGGLDYGLTVQQITSAYTVFPNQGVWRPSYLIAKITDRNGDVVYQAKPAITRVFSPQTAYIMTSILHDVVYDPNGTARSVGQRFPGYNIAGKTGTSDNLQNGWFIGFTPKYTMGIWMGYNHNQAIPDSAYALKFTVWSDIMASILKGDPPVQPYPEPAGIVSVAVCKKSGQLPSDLCVADHDVYNELFIEGTEPTATCRVHVRVAYTVIGGKKYLATTRTPPWDVRTGVFLKPPWPVPPGTVTLDSGLYAPTKPDPRGGAVLLDAPDTAAGSAIPVPRNVTASVTPAGIIVTWDPVAGANGYTVWRATSPDGPYVDIAGPVNDTTVVDATPPPGAAALYYQVRAQTGEGISDPSPPVAVQVGAGGFAAGPGGGGDWGNSSGGADNGAGGGWGNSIGNGAGNGSDNYAGNGAGNETGQDNSADNAAGSAGNEAGPGGGGPGNGARGHEAGGDVGTAPIPGLHFGGGPR